MMVSYQSAKEEIKRSADIVELIGQFVQLRKAGRNHVGLCPFHTEKAPSFTVTPERQTFHCFGCKKGGDIFAFWMEYHSSTFPEALKDLAERYNVTISGGFSASSERKKATQREAIFDINERAALYFQKALSHPQKGRTARTYLAKRSLSEGIIKEFRIGYAPDKWDGLIRDLRRHHISPDVAAQAGLIIPGKNNGYYDRFRGRIIFPIIDLRKRIVGFGGRVLDDSLPKYLNTPETPVFYKRDSLYGLHASHKAIREKGRSVIVEGYMDWLALRMHKLNEVVATLGTALTDRHVRKLKGYAREAVVVFDSDEAGKRAALKSMPVFSNEGLSAKAAILPDGHDPDSYINVNGTEKFRALLDEAPSIFDFYLEQKMTQSGPDLEAKIRVLKEIVPAISEFQNEVQLTLYVGRLSQRMEIKEEVIWSALRTFRKKDPERGTARNLKEKLTATNLGKRFDDLHLLNLLIYHPNTVPRLMNSDWKIILSDLSVIEIVDVLFDTYTKEGEFQPEKLLERLKNEEAREQLREAIAEGPHFLEQEVEQAIAEIEAKANEKKISASIQKAKEQGDITVLNQLLKLKAQGSVR